MKKRKKLNLRWRNKIRGLKVGDNIWVNYIGSDDDIYSYDSILDEIGDKYIVVNHCIIEENELLNIRKL